MAGSAMSAYSMRPALPRREVAGDDDLHDVPTARSPDEGRGAEQRGEADAVVATQRVEAHQREAQARDPDLELEGAVRPADQFSGQVAEEEWKMKLVK